MKTLVILAFGTVLSFVFMFVEGFVILKFWDWFAIPILGAPSLTLMQCVGLLCIPTFILNWSPGLNFKYEPDTEEERMIPHEKTVRRVTAIGYMILYRSFYAVFAFIIGYLIHLAL